MALKTDDIDIRDVRMHIDLGGNGDYYIVLTEFKKIMFNMEGNLEKQNYVTNIRISTSGGNAPTDVKIAVAELFRALEKNKLNEHALIEANQ